MRLPCLQQSSGESGWEMPSVHDQGWLCSQKLRIERHAVARRTEVTGDPVDGEEPYPLLALRVVGGDLGVKFLRDTSEADAPGSLHHELLLQPQLLLEIFKLREEIDDLRPDAAYHLDLGEILLHTESGRV